MGFVYSHPLDREARELEEAANSADEVTEAESMTVRALCLLTRAVLEVAAAIRSK